MIEICQKRASRLRRVFKLFADGEKAAYVNRLQDAWMLRQSKMPQTDHIAGAQSNPERERQECKIMYSF